MNTTLRKVLAVSGTVGFAVNTGCFTYGPAMTGAPPAGAEVRAHLNSEGTVELARYLGPRVIAVDGTLSPVSGDTAMMISATWVQLSDGARQRWTGDDVIALPQRYLTSVQPRTIDRRKSIIAGIAIVASVAALGTIVMKAGSSDPPTTTGPVGGVFIRRGK